MTAICENKTTLTTIDLYSTFLLYSTRPRPSFGSSLDSPLIARRATRALAVHKVARFHVQKQLFICLQLCTSQEFQQIVYTLLLLITLLSLIIKFPTDYVLDNCTRELQLKTIELMQRLFNPIDQWP